MYKRIVGQKRLVQEVEAIIESIRKGNNFNIIFSGRSGSGKTHFVTAIANELNLDEFILYLNPANFALNLDKRFQVLDEAHLITQPELLYPFMDRKENTFFFMTNFYGKLVEPLRNRCIPLMLEPYTLEELAEIIFFTVNITEEGARYLANFAKNSPRVGKILAQRIETLARGVKIEKNLINNYLYILGITAGGLDENDKIYLTALNKAGGRASLVLLEKLTGFDSNHLQEIESYLVELGKIQITPRGRKLI